MKKALVIGSDYQLVISLPYLLSRAGFIVDVMMTNHVFKKNNIVKNCEVFLNLKNLTDAIALKNLNEYDFIVICDDNVLKNILDSEISLSNKLKLLSVNSQKDLRHICSKIGLAHALFEAGVSSPQFIVANNLSEAILAAEKLQYPVMIKIDFSYGGGGVFLCKNLDEIRKINHPIFNKPTLVQKVINGTEIDLSGLYRDGKLIYFSYAEIKVVIRKFGPSILRLYKPLSMVEEEVFLEMKKLGEGLGANGFANISCIKSNEDNKIYFFEADMRPNVWVDYSKFVGSDAAIKIANYFDKKIIMEYPQIVEEQYCRELVVPYIFRMSLLDILLKRYEVWKYLPIDDKKIVIKLLCRKYTNWRFVKKKLLKSFQREL